MKRRSHLAGFLPAFLSGFPLSFPAFIRYSCDVQNREDGLDRDKEDLLLRQQTEKHALSPYQDKDF